MAEYDKSCTGYTWTQHSCISQLRTSTVGRRGEKQGVAGTRYNTVAFVKRCRVLRLNFFQCLIRNCLVWFYQYITPCVLIITFVMRCDRLCDRMFHAGSPAATKLESVAARKALVKDVRQLSPQHQTFSPEAYHSLILHFAPKHTGFSFLGMYSR